MGALTLVSITGTHTDVTNMTSSYDVVKSLHRFLDGSSGVESMTLQRVYASGEDKGGDKGHTLKHVDIVNLQTFQARLYGIEYMLHNN